MLHPQNPNEMLHPQNPNEMLHQNCKELSSIGVWNFFCVRGLLLGTSFALVLFFWSSRCALVGAPQLLLLLLLLCPKTLRNNSLHKILENSTLHFQSHLCDLHPEFRIALSELLYHVFLQSALYGVVNVVKLAAWNLLQFLPHFLRKSLRGRRFRPSLRHHRFLD